MTANATPTLVGTSQPQFTGHGDSPRTGSSGTGSRTALEGQQPDLRSLCALRPPCFTSRGSARPAPKPASARSQSRARGCLLPLNPSVIDAPDVHARQAHHRTIGRLARSARPPPLPLDGRRAGVQVCSCQMMTILTYVYIFRKGGAGRPRSLRRAGGGCWRALKGCKHPLRIPKRLINSRFKFRCQQENEI